MTEYSLAHLPLVEQVKAHGLNGHSRFFFEVLIFSNKNSFHVWSLTVFLKGALYNLKNLLHGTVGFISQISNQIFLMKELPSHINEDNFKYRQLFEFATKKFSSNDKREKDTFLAGSVNSKNLSKEEKDIFSNKFSVYCDMASCGYRVSTKSQIFYLINYKRCKQ